MLVICGVYDDALDDFFTDIVFNRLGSAFLSAFVVFVCELFALAQDKV